MRLRFSVPADKVSWAFVPGDGVEGEKLVVLQED